MKTEEWLQYISKNVELWKTERLAALNKCHFPSKHAHRRLLVLTVGIFMIICLGKTQRRCGHGSEVIRARHICSKSSFTVIVRSPVLLCHLYVCPFCTEIHSVATTLICSNIPTSVIASAACRSKSYAFFRRRPFYARSRQKAVITPRQ